MQLDVDHKTVTDWCSFLRDLCSWDLLANPVQLGGPGHIVAVDESCVARAKPAANRHARPVAAQWVFGAVDLTSNEFVMELVPHRDGLTLLPIIQRTVIAGSEIWSDEWGGYNGLAVNLSVTAVHWRIIANLGFKFRSHFTVHCGRRAAGGRRRCLRANQLAPC